MKILVLSNCPLVEFQGSGYMIVNFARGLRARGHQVDLVGPEECEAFRFVRKAKAHRLTLGTALRAIRQVWKESYDIVEFYGAESWLAAAILHRWPGRSFMLVSHSNGLETYCTEVQEKAGLSTSWNDKPRVWYQKILHPPVEKAFQDVDGLVTISEYDRDFALAKGYQQPARLVAVEGPLMDSYLGQDVDFARPQVVGFCGSWVSRKGTKTLETDLARVLEEFPGCTVKLFGLGSSFVKEAHFAPHLRQRVEVIPFIADEKEFQRVYRTISIFILPSVYEGFGLVAAEAMASGCALVASKTGFAASLRDRVEAMLMPEARSPFLYEGIKELLEDEALRLRIAQEGYRRVQKLNWAAAVASLETTYFSWLREFRGEKTPRNGGAG